MSDNTAITISNLSKMYKLYSNKRDKVIDLFNLKFALRKNSYQEFWALRDINLEIPKGEKIGIIGRNGAGKSTLLKIICGNIEPTLGEAKVNGKVSALLELGTGFHPEFSGKENIFASLAYMGVTGKEAQRRYDKIVDFSELEEFIDNPIKTYSAGMYTRLAFSVATSFHPEILIIDEVLGAGDAYFGMKCVEKMLSLTSGGTTVLFVSHDLASVQRLCNRAVWIDRGRIAMEGDTLSITKSYGASVREQEEIRLKARNLGLSRQTVKVMKDEKTLSMLFHFINDTWDTFRGRHPVRRIGLKADRELLAEIKVGDAMDNDVSHPSHILSGPGYMEWGEPVKIDGAYARVVEDRGGIYKHAPFVLPRPAWLENIGKVTLEIEYKDASGEKVLVELYDGEKYNRIGHLENSDDGKWKTAEIEITGLLRADKPLEQPPPQTRETADMWPEADIAGEKEEAKTEEAVRLSDVAGDVYGSGGVTIAKVQFLDGNDRARYVFTSGETLKIRIVYSAKEPVSHPVFVAAIYRMDGVVAHQAISSRDGVDFGLVDGEGKVDIIYNPLLIGQGDYIVSVAIFHYLDLLSPKECPSYCLHDRKYQFKIRQPVVSRLDLGIVNNPVAWNHEKNRAPQRLGGLKT